MKRRLTALLLIFALLCPAFALGEAAQKVVYLTFDDGPKKDTPELVALLEELKVPATFFFLGQSVRAFPEHAKLVYEAGHAIGCHSMSHSYKRIKESTSYMERDIERFIETMREHVDPAFTTDLYRFPGGSTSYARKNKAFICSLGYAWFDWNAMNGDAQFTYESDEAMLNFTLRDIGDQEVVILLMHEGKARTRRTLPAIVEHFRKNGYEFRMISTDAAERELLLRSGARMMFPEK